MSNKTVFPEPQNIDPEDYYEYVGTTILTRLAQETLVWLRTTPLLIEQRRYTFDELYEAAKKNNHRRTRFGQNSLQSDLNCLWRLGLIDKYAEGFYIQSGRPYGVSWFIHDN
jgi:hypothetical protein